MHVLLFEQPINMITGPNNQYLRSTDALNALMSPQHECEETSLLLYTPTLRSGSLAPGEHMWASCECWDGNGCEC